MVDNLEIAALIVLLISTIFLATIILAHIKFKQLLNHPGQLLLIEIVIILTRNIVQITQVVVLIQESSISYFILNHTKLYL